MFNKKTSIICFSCLLSLWASTQSKKDWKVSSPEEQGMSSLIFSNVIKKAKQDNANIHSLLIVKNDHIILDASFYPFKNGDVHDLASVTKSVMSLLIGIAIDKKFINSEYELITNFFPEYQIENDTIRIVTIKDLLNMSSGFLCNWNDGEKELTQMRNSTDWVKFMLSLPANKPDVHFSYCSGNYYLLAEILQRTTKMSCHLFAEKYLFKPLNFGKSYWPTNYKGVNFGWGDLHISIYDFAKIGSLVLNDGVWKSKQIISKQWIEKIQPQHKIHGSEAYGYGWWLDSNNPDEIQAQGRGGQRLFIFRDKKMVIVTNGGGGYDVGNLDDYALQAISTYSEKENHYSAMLKEVKNAALPDISLILNEDFPVNELNKVYLLDRNEIGLKSISFKKQNSNFYIVPNFDDGRQERQLIGMNDQYKFSNEATFGLPIAVKGRWSKDTLFIDYNRLGRIENFKFEIVFKKNYLIDIKLIEASRGINKKITGRIF